MKVWDCVLAVVWGDLFRPFFRKGVRLLYLRVPYTFRPSVPSEQVPSFCQVIKVGRVLRWIASRPGALIMGEGDLGWFLK